MPLGGGDIARQEHDESLAPGRHRIGCPLDGAVDAVGRESESAGRPFVAVAPQDQKRRAGGAETLAHGADRNVGDRQRDERDVLAGKPLRRLLNLLWRTVGIFDQQRELAATHLIDGERRAVPDIAFAYRFA
ncbi:hypothetical protein D9M68_617640 [compost metagenome]